MSEIVGIFATSHTPVMVNLAHAASQERQESVFGDFRKIGEAIEALSPDVILLISDDHLHNFFLDNMPAFCIGAADCYPTPIEDWLLLEEAVLEGDPGLSAHILFEVMRDGFDPSYSMQLTLDHGTLVPLELAGITGRQKIIPIQINCVQPPMPMMRRCFDFGRAIGKAVRSYPDNSRAVVLATGGISHDVGTPRMGMLNEAFDRDFLAMLEAGDETALIRYCEANVDKAGNGAEEVRNWLTAWGMASGGRFATLHYSGMTEWYTGIAMGQWEVPAEPSVPRPATPTKAPAD